MSQGTQPGEDAFSILVATDNHLGFMEKDDVRRHDSFTAFEEICKLAHSLQVDFLLLGGDLFHDNKPSRATLVRTIDILRRYCLSDNPVRFQVVSDQTLNFPNSFGHVNYEDEHYNVGMPVFTVHGNHDDPAGIDNLSAVDILSSCNLVNYFGKSNMPEHDAAQITLHPVLLRKGANCIALYGLGYMRDERLRMIMDNPQGLQWIRPDDPGTSEDDWFNILVVHQNRAVRMTNVKKVVTVDESGFASFLDLVVWGHEHECRIEPQQPARAKYFISQPGSSVVTQLAEGEAKPKHVLHLRVQGNQFETQNIALTTPRPFEYAEVSLRDAQGVNARDPEELAAFLSATVQRMIAKAESSYRERRAAQLPEGLLDGGGREGSREVPVPLPLIRIRVDYSGFSTINSQRFGQQFVGKVANPHDMLMFFKAPTRKPSTTVLEVGEERVVQPDELNQSNIEQLLRDSNVKLEVLSLGGLAEALHGFVGRDEKHAFSSFLSSSLSDTQAWLVKDQEGAGLRDDEDILRLVEQRVLQDMEKRGGAAAAPGDGAGDAGAAQPMPNVSAVERVRGSCMEQASEQVGAGCWFNSQHVAWHVPWNCHLCTHPCNPCADPWPFQSAESIPCHATLCSVQSLHFPVLPTPHLLRPSYIPPAPLPRPFPRLCTAASKGGAGGRGMKQATFESMGLRGRPAAGAATAAGRAAASVGSTKVAMEEEEEIEDDDLGAHGAQGAQATHGTMGAPRGADGMMGAARGLGDVDMDKEEEAELEAVGLGSRASAARAASQRRSTAAASPISVGTAGMSVQSDAEESDEEEHVRHGGIEEDDEEEEEEEEEEEQRARAKRARRGVGGVTGGFSFTPSQVSMEDAHSSPPRAHTCCE
ncbi:unnamed protein product [Closterium sp. Naga37s-1]|nr:unnamed protein product [Closterium sp. Naga37s-1]